MNVHIPYYSELPQPFIFRNSKDLEQRIRDAGNKALLSSEQKEDLVKGIHLASRRIWPSESMRSTLRQLPRETIAAFMEELLKSESFAELESCLQLLEEGLLFEPSGFKTDDEAALHFRAAGHVKRTALMSAFEKEGKAIWKRFLVELKAYTYRMIEMLISMLELDELEINKEDINSYGAAAKFEFYLKLLAFPGVLFATIYTYIENKKIALPLTAAALLALITLPLAYLRYLKPCPSECGLLKNLSIDLLRENKPVFPRGDLLRQIEAAFKENKGVILVGPPGVGKSWVIRSLVQQIAAGTLWRSSQVFSCNSASLANPGAFPYFERIFEGYEDQVILFFDEFHSLFRGDGVYGMGTIEQMKTFCEDFKYIIGATTQAEFDELIKDQQAIVGRRFKIIQVDAMPDEQLRMALSFYMQESFPKLEFDPTVFDAIIQKASAFNPKTSTIDAAHSLLTSLASVMTDASDPALKERIVSLEEELRLLEQRLITANSANQPDHAVALFQELTAKKAAIAAEKSLLQQRAEKTGLLERLEAYRLKLRRSAYHLSNTETDLKTNPRLMRKWKELHARIRAATNLIRKQRVALGLPTCLNKDLVESFFELDPLESILL